MSRRVYSSPFTVETTSMYPFGFDDNNISQEIVFPDYKSESQGEDSDEQIIEEVVIYDGGDVNGFG